jgi:TPR repeat protein
MCAMITLHDCWLLRQKSSWSKREKRVMKHQLYCAVTAGVLIFLCSVTSAYADVKSDVATCDELAASPVDSQRPKDVAGVPFGNIDTKRAVPACKAALQSNPDNHRMEFQLARVLSAANLEPNKQFELAMKASMGGYFIAMGLLGDAYRDGVGTTQDYAKAKEWFEKAVEKGDAKSANRLGYMFEQGVGMSEDKVRANEFYKKSAELGNFIGMGNFGENLVYGRNVERNVAEGLRWLEKSVEGGNDNALTKLALIYDCDHCAPHTTLEPAKSAEFFLRALTKNEEEAIEWLITNRGKELTVPTLDAIQAKLQANGKTFETTPGKLTDSAIAVLKAYTKNE